MDAEYRKALNEALETGKKVLTGGGSALNAVDGTIRVMEDRASRFAREQGLEIVPPSYFFTERRFSELQEILKKEKNGTVGCCALDKSGNLAAGTSTGGMVNKKLQYILIR